MKKSLLHGKKVYIFAKKVYMIYQKMTKKFTRFIAHVNQCKPSKLRKSLHPFPPQEWISQAEPASFAILKFISMFLQRKKG